MPDQILMWAEGFLLLFGGAIAVHLYGSIAQLRDRLDASRDKIEAAMTAQLKDLWSSVHNLSEGIVADRREAASSRVHIATEIGKLVTRDDLRDEMVRFASQINRSTFEGSRSKGGES
jgi:small-conductance mechanosensitive channel